MDRLVGRNTKVKPLMETTPDRRSETAGAQTLRRGLAVLKLLARSSADGLRMSDISRRLGLPKATAVRLTRTLVEEGFVTHDAAARRYRLGPESFAVGLAAEPAYALHRMAAPVLRTLALETGDWVFFSVLQGLDVICLSRASGDMPYPASALKVGDRHPLGVGAGGVAMLASLPDDELEQVLDANAAAITRDYPHSTVPVIRGLVQETREKGYCVIPGIIVRGYTGLGVALVDDRQRPVAAIVLVSSSNRLNVTRCAVLGARISQMARELMAGARHEGDDG